MTRSSCSSARNSSPLAGGNRGSGGDLRRRCVRQVAKALDTIASKTGSAAKKNAQELDRAIAMMIQGKQEREALAKAHLAECAVLSGRMQDLVKTLVAVRESSAPALGAAIEQRIDEVREAVLAEVAALKSRPGAPVIMHQHKTVLLLLAMSPTLILLRSPCFAL